MSLTPRPPHLSRQLDHAAARRQRTIHALPSCHRPVDQHLAAVVLSAVEDLYGLVPGELAGPGKSGYVVEARRLACQLLFERDYGVTAIGRALCRDHSTVLHSLTRLETRLSRKEWDALQMARRDVRARLAASEVSQ